MSRRGQVRVLVAVVLAAAMALAQGPFPQGGVLDENSKAILAEIKDHSHLMDNVEYLTDVIGPRLTGSERLKRANEWTLARFKEYGVDAKLESWTIANGWERVSATGRILEPAQHPLPIAAAGWSPSTNGVIRGHVVQVRAQRLADLEPYKGKLKGAIVITGEVRRLGQPDTPAQEPAQAAAQRPQPAPGTPEAPGTPAADPREEFMRLARQRDEFFKNEGVAAILRESGRPLGQFSMTSAGRNFEIAAIPTAFVPSETFLLIQRLMKRAPVQVELEIANKIVPGPVEVYNTVAEIRGSEKPDEVVLLGAHLDSWDLANGAIDNGTGSSVVLEVARAMAALKLQPKRTIRFLLFSGEEQGLVGAREYVKAHTAELSKFSAILIHDTGTARVKSIGLSNNYQLREVMDRVVAPMTRPLGLEELSMRRMGGSDHSAFDTAGVPGFYCIQDMSEYGKSHHTQSDTFDKIKKDDLVQGAQVMALWAWRVADLPELLPKRPAAAQTSAGR